MSNENGSLPPHNIEAEKAVLGALILNPPTLYSLADNLRPEDFYLSKNRAVYEAIISLNSAGRRCDPVTLDAELSKIGQNGTAWIDYITELMQYPPDEAGAVDYAKIVTEKSIRRAMLQAGGRIQKLASTEDGEIEQQLGESERAVFEVRGSRSSNGKVAPAEYTLEYMQTFERLVDNGRDIAGLSTGFTDLDRLLNGLQAPHHYIIAARPAMGKSALALNIADNVATAGYPVAFFSLEMSHKQIMDRRISSMTRIDSQRIQKPWLLSSDEVGEVYAATGKLSERPLFVIAESGLMPSQIRARAMRLHAEHGIKLIVIDHLHLVRPDVTRNRKDLEVDDNIRSITGIYKTIGVPGITVSQLSRSVESRGDKRPVLSDLRESGAIEEEAFVAMFLYRDEYYNPETTDRPNVCEVSIGKNREGPTGTIDLFWHSRLISFRNLERMSVNL